MARQHGRVAPAPERLLQYGKGPHVLMGCPVSQRLVNFTSNDAPQVCRWQGVSSSSKRRQRGHSCTLSIARHRGTCPTLLTRAWLRCCTLAVGLSLSRHRAGISQSLLVRHNERA